MTFVGNAPHAPHLEATCSLPVFIPRENENEAVHSPTSLSPNSGLISFLRENTGKDIDAPAWNSCVSLVESTDAWHDMRMLTGGTYLACDEDTELLPYVMVKIHLVFGRSRQRFGCGHVPMTKKIPSVRLCAG